MCATPLPHSTVGPNRTLPASTERFEACVLHIPRSREPLCDVHVVMFCCRYSLSALWMMVDSTLQSDNCDSGHGLR